jgi:hypothetical protein
LSLLTFRHISLMITYTTVLVTPHFFACDFAPSEREVVIAVEILHAHDSALKT